MFDLPGVAYFVSRVPCAATITPDSLKAMAGEIARSASLILPGLSADVMAFGCTSGSLFIGPETVHARIIVHESAGPEPDCRIGIQTLKAGDIQQSGSWLALPALGWREFKITSIRSASDLE